MLNPSQMGNYSHDLQSTRPTQNRYSKIINPLARLHTV